MIWRWIKQWSETVKSVSGCVGSTRNMLNLQVILLNVRNPTNLPRWWVIHRREVLNSELSVWTKTLWHWMFWRRRFNDSTSAVNSFRERDICVLPDWVCDLSNTRFLVLDNVAPSATSLASVCRNCWDVYCRASGTWLSNACWRLVNGLCCGIYKFEK